MLTIPLLHQAAQQLAAHDPHLAQVLQSYGPPPLWERPAGFATLVYIILEQQVSLASARAAYLRLEAAINPISPYNFLTLSDKALKAIGFSRQKTGYGRYLAQAILNEEINLEALPALDDNAARAELIKLKGVGRWTADIYLMLALLRPDVWPSGDLALATSVRRVKRLDSTPDPATLTAMGEVYRPWRSVAARMFWHHYLSTLSSKK